jgi:hypothetical protein
MVGIRKNRAAPGWGPRGGGCVETQGLYRGPLLNAMGYGNVLGITFDGAKVSYLGNPVNSKVRARVRSPGEGACRAGK